MKKRLTGISLNLLLGAAVSAQIPAATVILDNAALLQNPENRVVEIEYGLTGDTPVYVTLGITTNGIPIPDPATVSGDITTAWHPTVIEPGSGTQKICWDARHDWPGNLTTQACAMVTAWFTNDLPAHLRTYAVVDLSGGPATNWYPVRYSVTPPDLSDPACKTAELWLRRIPAGTFTIGSPTNELARNDDRETQHQVTLTKDFYIGIFEVTQKQWELVTGENPSSNKDDTHPVEQVSYDMIRGATNDTPAVNWPATKSYVNPDSFMGRLREKTLFLFDLPTEAQWEYACRAGTVGAWSNGATITNANTDANLALLGKYNSNSHAVAGNYRPNAWGVYDMHGNILEWCLDWAMANLGTAAVTDPPGPMTGSNRSLRGGAYGSVADRCRSAWRSNAYTPDSVNNNRGFRVCVPLSPGQ